jgi:antitoxin (DNA-binding transcriptional repressor) of toxin-antitoxin stability system
MRHIRAMPMTTLTPTKARSNLSGLLLRALKGEEIGILVQGKIVVLRPVTVTATDYVTTEYGLAPGAWKAVSKKIHAKGKKARETGKAKRFTGNIEDSL